MSSSNCSRSRWCGLVFGFAYPDSCVGKELLKLRVCHAVSNKLLVSFKAVLSKQQIAVICSIKLIGFYLLIYLYDLIHYVDNVGIELS